MSKAEFKFRMEWDKDISVYQGVKCQGIKMEISWTEIPWKKLERRVLKLQKRIYQASSRGDVKVVRKLQKILLHSWSAKCLAVHKVTQNHQGKKTAPGVDGVKSLSPDACLRLVKQLKLKGKSQPRTRVSIAKLSIKKLGIKEKKPLGIPIMYNRALQALVKMALEPEWEAKFEPNSYSFRPGKSVHDAIEAIFIAIRHKAKYVLNVDIVKCFERLNHDVLLDKINTFPSLRRQIQAWLKLGIIDDRRLFPNIEETPPVGVISPLLVNIALQGMENRVKQYAKTLPGCQEDNINALSLIRYADNLVILHENLEVLHKCWQILADLFQELGLKLHNCQTKISHTLKEYEGNVGFDFLGFNIRQFPVGKCHSLKSSGKLLRFKTIITPGKSEVKRHTQKIGKLIDRLKSASQESVITALNPIITAWANYYSRSVSTKIFRKVDRIIFQQLWAWATRRHPNKPKKWVRRKYCLNDAGDNTNS